MTMERFHYDHNGHTIELPHLKNLATGVLRKVRKMDHLDAAFTIFESIADPESLDGIDSMTLEEFLDFQKAWEKASDATLGESGASSRS